MSGGEKVFFFSASRVPSFCPLHRLPCDWFKGPNRSSPEGCGGVDPTKAPIQSTGRSALRN